MWVLLDGEQGDSQCDGDGGEWEQDVPEQAALDDQSLRGDRLPINENWKLTCVGEQLVCIHAFTDAQNVQPGAPSKLGHRSFIVRFSCTTNSVSDERWTIEKDQVTSEESRGNCSRSNDGNLWSSPYPHTSY